MVVQRRMFGIDPQETWHEDQGNMVRSTTAACKEGTMYPIPANAAHYDIDTDSKGRTHF